MVYLGFRVFPGHRTFIANIGKVLSELGRVSHSSRKGRTTSVASLKTVTCEIRFSVRNWKKRRQRPLAETEVPRYRKRTRRVEGPPYWPHVNKIYEQDL